MLDKKKNEEAIFKTAVKLKTSAERMAYVKDVCGDDSGLLARVTSLLNVHSTRNNVLDVLIPDIDVTLDSPPISEGPGTVIGRYKLLEQIGEGGFGVVYMADQTKPISRRVALKIIKLGMDTKQVIARFEAERQALAMMEHPNIAKVLDAGATDAGRPYFVMELVKGIPITEYCDKNNLETRQRLELFVEVCKAVQHAHQKGIIHRDIKPSNVMITLHDGRPVPKVIDFGIAKATCQKLTEKTLFTRFAQMIGTPEYMSPEQAEFSGLDIDTRSDIYSLGVLLYQLLTGVTPFDAEKLREAGYVEMQRIICEEEPDKPSTRLSTMGEALTDVARHRRVAPEALRRLMRGDLDWIVMKTLEKDRTRRYESSHELAMDIERHLGDEPVLAHAPGRMYCLQKFLRRHRAQTAGALALLVLVAAVTVVIYMWNQNQRQRAEVESSRHTRILSESHEARAKGDPNAALETVESILNSRHVGSEARLLHAQLVLDLQGPTAAVQELEALLSEPEVAGQAHFLLAKIYYDSDPDALGRTEEYRRKWEHHRRQAERLLPPNADAYLLQATSAGTVRKTLELLDRALELDDKHYDSLRERAFLSYVGQDFFQV
ncbi:MAG: serine/threonine protein kinase, partial [Planctomycetota bacterium]